MRALVPVSVRADEEHGALGNRISAMMAPLPVWCEDPVERLKILSGEMGDLKASGQAVGAEILTKLTDFAPSTIASQAARLQPAQRFFNLVITNVPGPQFPLYVLGAQDGIDLPDGGHWPAARRSASGSCPTTARSTAGSSATTTRCPTSTASPSISRRRPRGDRR